MRIGVAYPRFAVGGIEKNILSSSAQLRARGHEVFALLPTGVVPSEELRFEPWPQDFRSYALPQAKAVLPVAREAKRLGLDVLHLHGFWIYPFTNALFALRGRIAPRVVWTPHLDLPTREAAIARMGPLARRALGAYHHRLGPAMLRRADAVVALSDREARVYREWGVARVEVIPNGVDRLPPEVARAWGAQPLRIVTSGRISGGKGVDVLLKAVGALKERGVPFHLDVAGPFESPAQERAILTLRDALGLAPHVTFHGFVSDAQMEALFHASHVYVMPSRMDTQPVRMLEALATGLPVVAADVGVVSEMIEDGAQGLLVPPEDPARLADALGSLAQDRARLAVFSKANYAARGAHAWASLVGRLESLYAGG